MQTRTKLALGSLVVPAAFLVRELVKLSDVEAKHAESEANFHRGVEESLARQAEAGAAGAGRDTAACVEWATTNCHPGAGGCDACTDALRGCLATSTKSEAYCASVPPYRATMPPEDEAASSSWQKAQSAKHGFTHWSCAAMFKFVQLHCHPLR